MRNRLNEDKKREENEKSATEAEESFMCVGDRGAKNERKFCHVGVLFQPCASILGKQIKRVCAKVGS